MSDWDLGRIYASNQQLKTNGDEDHRYTPDEARRQTRDFIRSFLRGGIYPYREALHQNYKNKIYHLEIDLRDIKNTHEMLHDVIVKRPNEFIPMVEEGATDALKTLVAEGEKVPPIQVLFQGELIPTQIRQINAQDVNRLVLVPGIVISATRTRPKAIELALRCRGCGTEQTLPVPHGFGGTVLPRVCNSLRPNLDNAGNPPPSDVPCPIDPFMIVADKCSYMDQQTLKLQEAPETVPTGEMPRHLMVAVERTLADQIAPGTRVSLIGIVSIMAANSGRGAAASRGAAAVRTPYLRVVGVMVQEEGTGRATTQFTPEQEAEFKKLAAQPALYERLASSIAPSITGDYTGDIKKAILCLLMAGSRKVLPDGMRLRGDINVLLLGDPSTAKSQFLKFVEKVAPVGVYTSGKGSSAAGLTASVIRDAKGEFYLEGGAMVLADGGVVCIDEFDKMREEDRVAIHEAMEQQTISVAKAGITTILNSRSAVLAAANPVFGRYDDTKSAADNIDLLPTILSRFDLIFIVRDIRNEKRDHEMALGIVNLHKNAGSAADMSAAGAGSAGAAGGAASSRTGDIDIATLKRYITYARNKCAPRLTADAAQALQAEYVQIRQGLRATETAAREDRLASSEEHGVIPITVRQLEALVRITEAIAKSTLSPVATRAHVEEAVRLFHVSTLLASKSGLTSTLDLYMGEDTKKRVHSIENRIQKMIPLAGTIPTSRLREQLGRAGFNDSEIGTAIKVMERRDELILINERKTVRRNK